MRLHIHINDCWSLFWSSDRGNVSNGCISCLFPPLTHSYWRNRLFVGSSHRQHTIEACQTTAPVSKHLITVCIDSQDWHSKQSLSCLCLPTILGKVRCVDIEPTERKEERKKERKGGQVWLILRKHFSHVSEQVTSNLSQFPSKDDNQADALCRLVVTADGISVRDWMYVISGFRLSQTPVAVLKESRHFSSWKMYPTENMARSTSSCRNSKSRSKCVTNEITVILQCDISHL